MLRIKSAQWGFRDKRPPDFTSVDVRRLHGLLAEFEGWAKSAKEKMDELLNEGRYDVTYSEVQQMLGYELGQLGLNV